MKGDRNFASLVKVLEAMLAKRATYMENEGYFCEGEKSEEKNLTYI